MQMLCPCSKIKNFKMVIARVLNQVLGTYNSRDQAGWPLLKGFPKGLDLVVAEKESWL